MIGRLPRAAAAGRRSVSMIVLVRVCVLCGARTETERIRAEADETQYRHLQSAGCDAPGRRSRTRTSSSGAWRPSRGSVLRQPSLTISKEISPPLTCAQPIVSHGCRRLSVALPGLKI
jgi:hypothetical protein